MKKITNAIPTNGKTLVKYKGSELIERLGSTVIYDVVSSILAGGNVRAMTEKLTQRRVALSNSAMLATFLNLLSEGININELFGQIEKELSSPRKLTIEERNFLQWMLGLTGKSIQNVLRGDKESLKNYVQELQESINENSKIAEIDYGIISGMIRSQNGALNFNWSTFQMLSLAIGTQTLAIRGAEKSMYGKFFEKLILGALLTILGFDFISSQDTTRNSMVFWLSERGDKRESDATLLFKPGKGVRFDIGFIGVGNTEISLDKVSRFEREMERGSINHYMKTIVLIDRIGEGSRIVEMAKAIDGVIIQMSMTYWVFEVATILKESLGYRHEILNYSPNDSIRYIQDNIIKVDLNQFITSLSND